MQQLNVVGAIIVREGRILAAQKASGPLIGHWEFPGGKVEPGESLGAALVREILEELSCQVEPGALVERTDHDYDFVSIRLTTVLCKLVAGEPQAREHSAVRWISPDETHLLQWAPADLPSVRRLKELSLDL